MSTNACLLHSPFSTWLVLAAFDSDGLHNPCERTPQVVTQWPFLKATVACGRRPVGRHNHTSVHVLGCVVIFHSCLDCSHVCSVGGVWTPPRLTVAVYQGLGMCGCHPGVYTQFIHSFKARLSCALLMVIEKACTYSMTGDKMHFAGGEVHEACAT